MNNQIQTFQGIDPNEIRKQIEGSKSLAALVKASMGIERFTEAALQLLKTPALAACTQESVLGGLLKAAMFNFRLSPELGQCWLIPRNITLKGPDGKDLKDSNGKNQKSAVATFQIGYKGWQELAFRSGEIESFSSAVVWENDAFDYEMGSAPFLKYKACKDPKSRGKRTHVWAAATFRSGRVVFHVVDIDEVERHRKMSDTQKDWSSGRAVEAAGPVGIWAGHYDMMAMRIPMRYLCTLQIPKSEVLIKAIEADGGTSELKGGQIVEVGGRTVEDQAEVVLHEDYVNELNNCKTLEEMKIVHERQIKNMDASLKPLYRDAAIKRGQELGAKV